MKRSKTVKPNANQRSISSFFSSVSSPSTANNVVEGHSTSGEVQVCAISATPTRISEVAHEKASLYSAGKCTTTNKRKRQEIFPSSPDFISATPPLTSCTKDEKPFSVSLTNKKSKQSLVSSDSKQQGDLVKKMNQSPINKQCSPFSNTNSKTALISPIKTEDDEILWSILEHISPQKANNRKPEPPNLKKSLFSVASTQNVDDDGKCLNNESTSHLKTPVKVSQSSIDSKRKVVSTKEAAESSTKQKFRKSTVSPTTSQPPPELKYPRLTVRTSASKLKAIKETPSEDVKSSSPKKQATNPIPGRNSTIYPPVRRSPRKHSIQYSTEIKQEFEKLTEEEEAFSKICEESTASGSGKENTGVDPVCPRRSPRKHASSSCPDKNLNGEKNKRLDTIQSETLSSSSTSKSTRNDCSKEHEGLNADEHDDIMAYIANMNETDLNLLDLSEPQLCEVIAILIKVPSQEAEINVRSIRDISTASCTVRGCWLACPVSEGDSISLQAARVEEGWLLDSAQGFLVLHPDNLISGTTVVGSLFCARRSVLSSMFRGMDSDSPIMVIGSIVHELFQMVLQNKKKTETDVRRLSEQLLASSRCIKMLHGANMSSSQIQKELCNFIPRIVDFVEKFVDFSKTEGSHRKGAWLAAPTQPASSKMSQGSISKNGQWNGKIVGIHDIEETLWDPKLGIKGMVDVSVEVRDASGLKKILPLELKTGRASFSAEHRGQVTLYTMMMSKFGQPVNSGLLLYLREGQMKEISVSHNESKDLIHLRNTLAHFLKPRIPIIDEGTKTYIPARLPDPIHFKSACEKCPYATLCSVYLQRDGILDLSPDHPMVSVSSSASQHLHQSHIDYFMQWVGLLYLEESDQLRSAKFRHIWRFTPEEREKGRQAISNLCLLKPVEETSGKFIHSFSRMKASCNTNSVDDLRDAGLKVGDYIVISTNTRVAIDHGSIADIGPQFVKVSTNRNLHGRYSRDVFHVDLSHSSTVLVFNLTNLGCLLDSNESAEKLRKIVIERSPPTFCTRVEKSIITDSLQIFSKLNNNQRTALIKTLRADSYVLIKGLPGTGKTATMVALVQLLVSAGLSVLVTSHTHSAVDNLLLRLKKAELRFLRLGADTRIHPGLQLYSESFLTKHCKTPEDLDKVYSQQHIVGVTCLGAGHPCISKRLFDVCLVDESTQVLQPSVLRPLLSARRFVLVGDPDQLPPVVKSHQAQELGMSESLFARLDSDVATVSLTLNYRMNQAITDLANGLTYGGRLKCGSESVATATLKVASSQVFKELWLSTALSTDIDKSVVFVDTSDFAGKNKDDSTIACEETELEPSCTNNFELTLVLQLLNAFVDAGVPVEEIGVMAPYRAQVSLLMQSVKSEARLTSVEVNTVDQFQGRDKEVMVYSCTRSNGTSHQKPKDREILNDQRRLTVAITRAKHKLVLIGHATTLQLYTPFQKLLSCVSKGNVISYCP